jgi:hypothetical protein
VVRNSRVQAQDISRLRDLNDDGFAFTGGSGQFCLPGAEYEYSARLLAFNKQHRRLRIDRRGFDLVQLLNSRQGQIAEEVLLTDGAGDAVVKDGQAVRDTHGTVQRCGRL